MKIPALALFERSLRLESRSALMSWSRAGLLILILLMLVPVQSMARSGFFGAPGLHFLQQMVWVNLVFITLAGLSYFSSAITEEKEEMMLGLLRMTNLNPVAILLGKSTSRLVGSLLLLLVQVPFVLLAVTLGGVGLVQIAAAYGTLLAYLFLVSNLALLLSVVFRTTNVAAAGTFALLMLFLIGPFWAADMLETVAASEHTNLHHGAAFVLSEIIGLWRRATPADRLGTIFQTGFAGPAVGFQMVADVAAGVVLFLVAWLVFDRCTREEKESAPVRRWFSRRTSRSSRVPAGIKGMAAVAWKDFTFIGGGRNGLLIKFATVAFLVVLFNFIAVINGTGTVMTPEFEGGVLIWVSLIVTAICLAVDASRVFQEEIRWKTLSALATLPVPIAELAYRKVAGTLAGTLPLLAGVVLGALLDQKDVGDFLTEMFKEPSETGAFILVIAQYLLFLHLTAFLSLVVKRGALPLAIGIQYIGGFMFMTLMVFSMGGNGEGIIFSAIMVCLAGAFILHGAIGRRLARAAAEE